MGSRGFSAFALFCFFAGFLGQGGLLTAVFFSIEISLVALLLRFLTQIGASYSLVIAGWWAWVLLPLWSQPLWGSGILWNYWPGHAIQLPGWDPARLEPLYTLWGSQIPLPPSSPWGLFFLQACSIAVLYFLIERSKSPSQ